MDARPADGAGDARRFVFVDALRGVAAMWVVVFHIFTAKHVAHLESLLPHCVAQFIHKGYLGIDIFFVLSGFVIAYSVGQTRVGARYIGWFMLRRSIRLDPPYWASILVIVVVTHQQLSGPRLLAHMFYLQDLLRFTRIAVIYWTLCLEIQFYLVFVVLLGIAWHLRSGATDRRSLFLIFAVAAVVAAVFPLGVVYRETLPAGLFLPRWYTFLGGVFAYWAVEGTIRRRTFYVYSGVLFADAMYVHNAEAIVSMAVGALLLETGRAGRLYDWLNGRPFQFLGKISYSLYLMHGPITVVTLRYTLYRLTPRTAAWELVWLEVVLITNCLVAWLFWRLIEAPCMVVARHCRPSTQRASQSVLATQ